MKNFLIILALAVLLSIILSWPLVANIASYYSDQGDYALGGSILWYNQDSIKTGRIFHPKEYWQGYQFYPHPFSLAFANSYIVPSLIFSPIFWLTDSLPFSVNSYALLTLILSFIASFYTVNFFVKNSWAAMVGAFIFTFNANTQVRFPQHLDVLSKYFLPLVFLFAYQLLEKPSFKKSFLFFLFFTLNALTVTYYQIFSLVILPIVALPFLINHLKKKDWKYFIKFGKVSLVGLIFLPILLFFNLPYWDFSQKEGAFRPLEATPFFSARMTDWLASSPDSLIYGKWVKGVEKYREPKDDRGVLNYEEHTLFLGLIPLILFFIGLKRFRQEKINQAFFYLLLILPAIFTFGPYFNGATQGWPLPFYFFHKLFPFMEGIRSPTRFEFLLFVPFSLICAFGVRKLMEGKSIIIITIIIVILILENFTLKDFNNRSAALATVQNIGRDNLHFLSSKAVLHLPIYTTEDADEFGKNSAYLNWLTQTGEKIVNGNTSYLPPDHLGLLAAFKQQLAATEIGILKTMDVSFIIIHKDKMPAPPIEGVIFDNQDVSIVDLSNFKAQVPLCSVSNLDIQVAERDLIVTNPGNCYLISAGESRYQKMGRVSYRLPIVISPNQQIVLTQINREVRIR